MINNKNIMLWKIKITNFVNKSFLFFISLYYFSKFRWILISVSVSFVPFSAWFCLFDHWYVLMDGSFTCSSFLMYILLFVWGKFQFTNWQQHKQKQKIRKHLLSNERIKSVLRQSYDYIYKMNVHYFIHYTLFVLN